MVWEREREREKSKSCRNIIKWLLWQKSGGVLAQVPLSRRKTGKCMNEWSKLVPENIERRKKGGNWENRRLSLYVPKYKRGKSGAAKWTGKKKRGGKRRHHQEWRQQIQMKTANIIKWSEEAAAKDPWNAQCSVSIIPFFSSWIPFHNLFNISSPLIFLLVDGPFVCYLSQHVHAFCNPKSHN